MMDGQGEGKGDSVFRFLGEEDSGRAPTFSWVALCGLGQPLHTFLSSPGLIDGIDSQYQLPDMGRREASVSSLLPESGWDALVVPLWGPWRARARGQVGETRPTGPLASFSHSSRPDRRPTCQGHGQPLRWGVVLSESNASHRDTEGAISLANSVMAAPLPTVHPRVVWEGTFAPKTKQEKEETGKKLFPGRALSWEPCQSASEQQAGREQGCRGFWVQAQVSRESGRPPTRWPSCRLAEASQDHPGAQKMSRSADTFLSGTTSRLTIAELLGDGGPGVTSHLALQHPL